MRWIISFPCWGESYRQQALDGPLHSVLHALKFARIKNALFIVNTDCPASFADAFNGQPHEVRYYSVPEQIDGMEKYSVFGCAHRQAIELADPYDRVALLCGDMTVSEEAFTAAENIFASGKKLIMAAASSTVGRAPFAKARDLLEWSIDHLTPMCRDLFWKEGRGSFPWCVYFRHKDGIDFRGFHLHPFAVVKRPGLTFLGNTSDLSLSCEFPEYEVHVVTSPDELALVERSPADRSRPKGFKIKEWTVVTWAAAMGVHANERHVWHFAHQITLKGKPDPENYLISGGIIKRIYGAWDQAAAAKERKSRRAAIKKLVAASKMSADPAFAMANATLHGNPLVS